MNMSFSLYIRALDTYRHMKVRQFDSQLQLYNYINMNRPLQLQITGNQNELEICIAAQCECIPRHWQ